MDSMVNKHIAIILARGGSKRLPNKNILDFHGKPMIAWTIEAAIESKEFSHVVVSTDSKEIAEISISYGAHVPFLRKTHADDHTPSSTATITALKQAEEYYEIKFNFVSQLMANCPLRSCNTIRRAIKNFYTHRYDTQITCFKFGFMNPWWAFSLSEDNIGKKIFPEAHTIRSQDLGELYCPTGAIWTARSKILQKCQTFYSDDHRYFPISWQEGLDIDDIADFNFARATKLSLDHH